MQKRPLYFKETKAVPAPLAVPIPIADLERYAQDWLFDGEYRNQSRCTINGKRDVTSKLLWFLRHRDYDSCSTTELRQFLAYVATGHEEKGGRWGKAHLTNAVSSRTLKAYYIYLQGFFRWSVAEGLIPQSPLERIPAPIARSQQVQGFTREQIQALVQAARHTTHPNRDVAIIWFLYDTGIRASELCGLRLNDLDLSGRSCIIQKGKGGKRRTVHLGRVTAKSVWNYLREQPREGNDPVFISDRGTRSCEQLTRSGLLQLIERLGKAASVRGKCSPHVFRHTFAVEFLRNGGHIYALKELLGHNSLHMCSRYIALASSDMANQHKMHSPADRLGARVE